MQFLRMTGLLCLVCSFCMWTACRKNITPTPDMPAVTASQEPTVENGRLVFKDHTAYHDYISTVNPQQADKTGFLSLYTALLTKVKALSPVLTDLQQFDFPAGFMAALNEKGEVRIGDEIIWYHQGRKYFIPASDENSLEEIKANPAAITKSAVSKRVILQPPAPLGCRTILNNPDDDARHQQESFRQSRQNSGERKYVHEIITFPDSYWSNGLPYYVARLTLRVKPEWKGSQGDAAGEIREVTVNVTGVARYFNDFGTPATPGSYRGGPAISHHSRATVKDTYEAELGRFTGNGVESTGSHWDLEITGEIVQQVHGDLPVNTRINYGNPLW